jgi:hypothetical protein
MDLNGIASSIDHPPSKSAVRVSRIGFQSKFGFPSLRVAAHLVSDPAVGTLRVPDLGGDVHVLVVEGDPGLRPLCRHSVLFRDALDELGDRRRAQVEGLVDDAVDLERLGDADGPDRDAVQALLVHEGGSGRGRGVVDLGRALVVFHLRGERRRRGECQPEAEK